MTGFDTRWRWSAFNRTLAATRCMPLQHHRFPSWHPFHPSAAHEARLYGLLRRGIPNFRLSRPGIS